MNLAQFIDKLLVGFSRDLNTDARLRSRFKRVYGIEVGLHTFWRFNSYQVSKGTRIGRYCSIPSSARIVDENHPLNALSTHPLFYLRAGGLIDKDQVHHVSTVIEDDVWMGHGAIITPGCKQVGRGAVIGAGAVVMRDVPPYAVMTGAPAQLVRFRFPPELIVAIEATRWWELEPAELRELTRDDPGFLLSPNVATAELFARRRGLDPFAARNQQEFVPEFVLDEADLIAALRLEVPDFGAHMLDAPIGEIGIDSFGLIALRLALERQCGRRISDVAWGAVQVPRDLLIARSPEVPLPVADTACSEDEQSGSSGGGLARRRVPMTMPRMAMSGLSESWLLKEFGALHWSNIARGLGVATHEIADDTGARLYATVTTCRFTASAPLTAFQENDALDLSLSTTRMGAAIFFGEGELKGSAGLLRVSLATSFTKFGESGANTSLLKGQPVLPEGCAIPALDAMPQNLEEYRQRRSREEQPPLFTTEYEIQPPYDLNGVGLLYFAAYPIIGDLCAARHAGPDSITRFSTMERDVSYFANAGPSETLVYSLTRWEEHGDTLEFDASIARKSDRKRMASIATRKVRVAQ